MTPSTAYSSWTNWTNYETWVVACWLDQEEETYKYRNQLCDRAELLARHSERTDAEHLADMLKDWVESGNPLKDQSGLYSDLLQAALNSVDWHEIAENFLSD